MFCQKMTKLQKLVIGVTNVETRMRRHRSKARDKGYMLIPFHVPSDGRRRWLRWLKVSAKQVGEPRLVAKLLSDND